MIERYGAECALKNQGLLEKAKETTKLHYGVDNAFKMKEVHDKAFSKDAQEKRYETHKKNNSFHTSSIEQDFMTYLWSIFGVDDVIYQKKQTKEYPFMCDFYLIPYKLYIELNAHWTHGNMPFDKDDEQCKKLLKKWIDGGTPFYEGAIRTWTIRDPKKREVAKANNLNYLEIFSNDINVCVGKL